MSFLYSLGNSFFNWTSYFSNTPDEAQSQPVESVISPESSNHPRVETFEATAVRLRVEELPFNFTDEFQKILNRKKEEQETCPFSSDELPEFLALDFDSHNEKLILKLNLRSPLPSHSERIVKACKGIAQKTLLGATLGLLTDTSYVYYQGINPYRFKEIFFTTLGASVGFSWGASKEIRDYRLIELVSTEIEASRERTEKIIRAFLEKKKSARLHDQEYVTCMISQEVMIFPVKTTCGHTFEWKNALEALKNIDREKNSALCPTCRREISPKSLKDDEEARLRIKLIASEVFGDLEKTLNRLPKEPNSPRIDFLSKEILAAIASKTKRKESLIDDGIDEVVENIVKGTLSFEEAYTIAYYLSMQFKPLLETINSIYHETKKLIDKFYQSGKIDKNSRSKMLLELAGWREGAFPIKAKHHPTLYSLI